MCPTECGNRNPSIIFCSYAQKLAYPSERGKYFIIHWSLNSWGLASFKGRNEAPETLEMQYICPSGILRYFHPWENLARSYSYEFTNTFEYLRRKRDNEKEGYTASASTGVLYRLE